MNRLHLLDNASLFEILVRTHYTDLQSLFEVYPTLRLITESQYFKDTWAEYNIHTVEQDIGTLHKPLKAISEVDRLGHKQGTTKIYEHTDVLIKTIQYANNVQNGLTIWYYSDTIQCTEYWHRGSKQGLVTWYRTDGTVLNTCTYVDNKKHGLEISYGGDIIHWQEWFNDARHGKDVEWYPGGNRKRER